MLTGITEETVFRGVVLQNCLGYLSGNLPLAAAASVALFALGHINPLALGPGTAVLFGLQLATGASFMRCENQKFLLDARRGETMGIAWSTSSQIGRDAARLENT